MARRHHYRRRAGEQAELDMTTFLNLMVVLVPFLLITAVFSRITIVELDLPTRAGGAASAERSFRLEVIVREGGFEVSDGRNTLASIPRVHAGYDLRTLSEVVMALKQDHPDADDASVLLEPDIAYDHLIQVMDTVRSTKQAEAEGDENLTIALFSNISIGDAP
jgi:biopolymer transport protein ExbD